MKNSTNNTAIIKDLSVFDYVAGKQSENTRNNFEKTLEQDTDLMQEVLAEKQLRETLENSLGDVESEPVSMKNFDTLIERIELDEKQSEENSRGDAVAIDRKSADNVIAVQSWRWQKSFNIAASFVFVAMIGVIGFNQIIEPSFTTLSNKTASADIDFGRLVEQQRVVKLEFSEDLASSDIAELLTRYQLSSIQSGAVGQTVIASSPQAVDASQLASWAADHRIVVAELVSFDAE